MVITTHNRSALLARSLEALQNLTWPDELIVVDDGGFDACEDVCDRFGAWYVYNDNPGLTNCCLARNIGLRLAHHPQILVCEPEVMFLTDVVAQMKQAREEHPKDILYGWTYHANNDGSGIVDAERIGHFPYYTLYKRDWLIQVGGWDEAFPGPWAWDDVDLNGRLAELGHGLHRVEECEALHQWHPSRIELAVENEAHARSKRWPQDIVANRGVEWGQIR